MRFFGFSFLATIFILLANSFAKAATCGDWKENGFFVKSGDAQIYAWTKQPYFPANPTVIFVNGGPGDHSHDSAFDLPGWNVVFFDQRGIACSRTLNDVASKKRSFYASENTVQDIESIRQFLQVEDISVYGVSYGTIPAHLYAARFPAHVKGLVLEGTVADSSSENMIANLERRQLLQNFFDRLPQALQTRVLQLSQNPKFSPAWFSQVGKMMFYLDHAEDAFQQFLAAVVFDEQALLSLLPGFQFKVPEETEFGFGSLAFRMISCQEMGMNSPEASFDFVFHGHKLAPSRSHQLRESVCKPLGFSETDQNRTFKSAQFSLSIPVTYIQGEKDGITPVAQAFESYQNAAYGFSQWVLVKEGGHQPLQGTLQAGYEVGPKKQLRQQLLNSALQGSLIPEKILTSLTKETNLGWSLLFKMNKQSATHITQ